MRISMTVHDPVAAQSPAAGRQAGFTLIELMIVVSIIGILAAVALPVYERYMIRSQVTEGLNLSSAAKDVVSDYYMYYGIWPTDNGEAGLSDKSEISGTYTAQIEVKDNVIEIQYGNSAHSDISGQLVALVAVDNAGSVSWSCASAGVIEDKHLPDACR